MIWRTEDILDANPREGIQSKSRLERLLDLAGTNLEILSEAANEQENRIQPHVAAFFQLPYHLYVAPNWHRVSTLEHGLYAELKFEHCAVTPTEDGHFRLLRNLTGQERIARVTQVVAFLPVWGKRSLFHDKYLYHVGSPHGDNPVIVPQRESWVDNRPLFRRDYEANFASRLIRELTTALHVLLPAYSVRALQEAPLPQFLYSYHTMLAPGYLVYAGKNASILEAMLKSREDAEPIDPVSNADLTVAMQTRHRNFSHFELQLFALERLRREGEAALALIGCLSLLEWLLNLYILSKGGKKTKLFKALTHPYIDFLSEREVEILDRARQARNLAVHEKPSARQSPLDHFSGRELGGISTALPPPEVRVVMEITFKAFREINLRGIQTT